MNDLELTTIAKVIKELSLLIGRHYAETDLDRKEIITILEDFPETQTQPGGDNMPPTYADGSFRTIKKNGLLQYRFMYEGKQIPIYGYTKQECYKRRYEYEIKKAIKKATNKIEETNINYKTWLNQWLKEKKPKCKPGYFKQLERYINKDIIPILGKTNIKDLKTDILQKYLDKLESDTTRTKIAAILSESIRRAYELQKIPFNVFLGVRFKIYEPPHKKALTHKEQLILFKNIKDTKLLDLTKLLILTGLRQGEALALTPENIKEDTIRVNKNLEKTTKSMLKPKTKASIRTIPINAELFNILKKYINNKRLFDYNNDYISKFYSKTFKNLGIEATGHTLRHTFITNAYEIGVPAYIVQRWAGHAKAEQADTYLDLRKSEDFIETWIVKYMLELKKKYVPEKV